MSLEYLTKPVKWLDEQLLRQYTKLARKVEKDKGIDKYQLSSFLNFSTKVFILPSYALSILNKDYLLFGAKFGISTENTFELFDFNSRARKAEYLESNYRVKDLFVEKMKSIYNLVRLPTFVIGASQVVKGGINLYNSFSGKDSTELSSAISELSFGIALLSWSSAMYVRDSDPKLLEKASVWKTAYAKLKEKVKGLVPKPAPVLKPVPIQNTFTIENRV